ncbi:MAG: DUF368 domain-containing protein [Oscillospiraceae bacterium]
MNYIMLALKGIAIGIANAVPGVSGGTIAVITKIYDKLLAAITPNIKKLIKNLPFLIPVGLGMLIGILAAAKVLGFLFDEYNVPTQMFFIGVVIGSIPMIYKECTAEKKLSAVCIAPFAAGILVMVAMALLSPAESTASGGLDLAGGIILFISSVLAAAAMIIPGISGALIFKVLGAYDMVIGAVNDFNIPILLVVAFGAVVGIFAAAGLITMLLKKFRRGTYCLIGGLIIGSIPSIFPGNFAFDVQGIVGIIMLIVGIAVPFLTELPTKKKAKQE